MLQLKRQKVYVFFQHGEFLVKSKNVVWKNLSGVLADTNDLERMQQNRIPSVKTLKYKRLQPGYKPCKPVMFGIRERTGVPIMI
jgi:hypothetical protein